MHRSPCWTLFRDPQMHTCIVTFSLACTHSQTHALTHRNSHTHTRTHMQEYSCVCVCACVCTRQSWESRLSTIRRYISFCPPGAIWHGVCHPSVGRCGNSDPNTTSHMSSETNFKAYKIAAWLGQSAFSIAVTVTCLEILLSFGYKMPPASFFVSFFLPFFFFKVSLCSPCWGPEAQRSACLCLLNSGIKVLCHQPWFFSPYGFEHLTPIGGLFWKVVGFLETGPHWRKWIL